MLSILQRVVLSIPFFYAASVALELRVFEQTLATQLPAAAAAPVLSWLTAPFKASPWHLVETLDDKQFGTSTNSHLCCAHCGWSPTQSAGDNACAY